MEDQNEKIRYFEELLDEAVGDGLRKQVRTADYDYTDFSDLENDIALGDTFILIGGMVTAEPEFMYHERVLRAGKFMEMKNDNADYVLPFYLAFNKLGPSKEDFPHTFLEEYKLLHERNDENARRTAAWMLRHVGRYYVRPLAKKVMETRIDLAPTYQEWRVMGCALWLTLGENGRKYFHLFSQFNPKYTIADTNDEFDDCQRDHGTDVTLAYLMALGERAGICVPKPLMSCDLADVERNREIEDLTPHPAMPTAFHMSGSDDPMVRKLPPFLRRVVARANSDADADALLLGAVTVLSSCLPFVTSVYDERLIFSNLFLFVTAPPATGKGRLAFCLKLVEPIHERLRYYNRAEWDNFKASKGSSRKSDKAVDIEPNDEPPLRTLIIPANSSATAMAQTLSDNDGMGLIFETEGDTLTQTFQTEHGNYSDLFRKAFQHESISYNRRKDRELVELPRPRLSAVLSGTPRQVTRLIGDAENGLFSRFAFYYMQMQLTWNDVTRRAPDGQTLDEYFGALGDRFLHFYDHMMECMAQQDAAMDFRLSERQSRIFNRIFRSTQMEGNRKHGDEYVSSVRRMALITYRIAMILSAIRLMDDGIASPADSTKPSVSAMPSVLMCGDDDFSTAMSLSAVLMRHTEYVYTHLLTTSRPLAMARNDVSVRRGAGNGNVVQPAATANIATFRKAKQPVSTSPAKAAGNSPLQRTILLKQFVEALPDEFNRTEYLQIANQIGLNFKKADRYIKSLCEEHVIERISVGHYRKLTNI
jgi:hypothetical protein